jgi:hypothetical protein
MGTAFERCYSFAQVVLQLPTTGADVVN